MIGASMNISPASTFGNASSERATTKLRSQLSTLGDRFSGFDDIVADETRQRRNTEEQKYRGLNTSLIELQQALEDEISNQVDSSKVLREHLQSMTNEMLRNLQKNVMKSLERNMIELDTLLARCDHLETSMAELKSEIPAKLQAEMTAVVRGIHHMREIIKQDQEWKLERDNALSHSIVELQQSIVSKINAEAAIREEQREILKHKMEKFAANNDSSESQFREFVNGEMQIMKKGLELATEAREHSDSQILKALYQYTEVLEKGVALGQHNNGEMRSELL